MGLEGRVARRLARVRYRLPSALGAIGMTFDDGPDPETTPVILDLLAEHDARATFFMLGSRAAAQPALVRRILDEGHAVGSHSATHRDPWAHPHGVARDIREGRTALQNITGHDIRLFRPPYGEVTLTAARAIRSQHLRAWLWTHDPLDWHPDATASSIVSACRNVAAGDIVLLHDAITDPISPGASDRTATIDAVAQLLCRGRERGLRWIPLE